MRAGAALAPQPLGTEGPTGLAVSRDASLGCPCRQEGLAQAAGLTRLAEGTGVAGHRCHYPAVPKEGLTSCPLSARPSQGPGGARAEPRPCSPCRGGVRSPLITDRASAARGLHGAIPWQERGGGLGLPLPGTPQGAGGGMSPSVRTPQQGDGQGEHPAWIVGAGGAARGSAGREARGWTALGPAGGASSVPRAGLASPVAML